MARRKRKGADLALDMALLGWEAQWVIGLRMMRVAAGGAAGYRELQRMVTEKAVARLELQTRLAADAMLGKSHRASERTVRHYRSKVRANYRRLTRKR